MRFFLLVCLMGSLAVGGVTLPGFGAVMHEYGVRFWALYYAARARAWELAAYELHEQLEAQELGEAVRPRYAARLKAFEASYLRPLESAVRQKDFKTFAREYEKATQACNRCHTETGHGYIRYRLPSSPPPMLVFGE